MTLKDLPLQRSYETLNDRAALINNFYIPTLKETVTYNRVAGFFSSSSLVVAAEGIASLIENGGIMKLLISPELSNKDSAVIKKEYELSSDLELFSDINIEEWLKEDNLRALAWLLDVGRLQIKIVIDEDNKNTLFHQKIGIMIDYEGNAISFSGSINESAKAWLNNIEEFKVFKSWESGQNEYYQDDFNKFNRYWNSSNNGSVKVYNIPDAVKKEIIKSRPTDVYDLSIMEKYRKNAENNKFSLGLFDHQRNAVNMWIENNYKLLDIMATGTGKTRTALACICELIKERKKFITIISTPENSLTNQWVREVEELHIPVDKILRIESGNKWKEQLENALLDMQLNRFKNEMLLLTHTLLSSNEFIDIVKRSKGDTNIFYICDECHAIGSPKQKRALLDEYEMRLGLSATPERMYDDYGTSLIYNYFGRKTFEFGIYEALNTKNPLTHKPYLNSFKYFPIFVMLNCDEWLKYKKKTKQIIYVQQAIKNGSTEHTRDELERLLNYRAKIIKNAASKYDAYDSLIRKLKSEQIFNNIITFVSDVQISKAMEIAKNNGLFVAKVTENEDAKIKHKQEISERDKIILDFKNNRLNMLLGISCLDQGIDIPNARIAVLMSSSTNPREYVQRIGRVIRQHPNKDVSIIYDFIVVPPNDHSEESIMELNVIRKEAKRTSEIACNAINYDEVIQKYREIGVELNEY